MTHASINPVTMYLHHLIDGAVHKVQVIGVSSYKGCAPTFLVLTEEGALYADIPGHLLAKRESKEVTLDQLVYQNNPSEHCWVGRLSALEKAQVFGRDHAFLGTGSYIATMDWTEDNWMAHVILMQTGNLAGRLIVWPHFRILWNTDRQTLPTGYLKVRDTWRV